MKISNKKPWLKAMVLSGILYILIGIIFPLFSKSFSPSDSPNIWRVISFLVSAIVFGIHIGYEYSRLNDTPFIIALHTSLAVALGTIALAGFAYIQALSSSPGNQSSRLIAILIWPIITGVLSFLVALVIAAGLTQIKHKSTIKNS